ncbi:MAG: hypothetical protein FWG75_08815 [Cystobacterineae bacterium]|nr:hypothetical protein [Cystobacterineae bacterium]
MKPFAVSALCALMLGVALVSCSSSKPETEITQPPVSLPGPEDTAYPPDAPRLNVDIVYENSALTPMAEGAYDGRAGAFTVVVTGFENSTDAANAELSIGTLHGLWFTVADLPVSENSRVFQINVRYDGTTTFPEGFANVRLHLTNIEGYALEDGTQTLRISIRDGQARNRPIPVSQDSLRAFNSYANTEEGLKKHYRLVENVTLPPPPANESNWTIIGSASVYPPFSASPFTGSFDGGGFSLFGLRAQDFINDYQGLFGYIEGAVIENLGLIDVWVVGNNYAGALVGGSDGGTVRNCYAAGDVNGSSAFSTLGGLVGENRGRVQNAYFSGNASSFSSAGGAASGGLVGINHGMVQDSHATGTASSGYAAGGLVGINQGTGTVQGSHATGTVTARLYYAHVGGLVGENWGRVQDSHAMGDVIGGEPYYGSNGSAGGLVGVNHGGTVQSSYATGRVSSGTVVGGLVGNNIGTLQNSYARGSVSGRGEYIGGLVGSNSGTVQHSYATGSVAGLYRSVDEYYYAYCAIGGLVGMNVGTLHNCMALNATVNSTAGTNIGRVVGAGNGPLSDNRALDRIIDRDGNAPWLNIDAAGKDGANISVEELQRAGGFSSEFHEEPWTYVEGRLPGLRQPVDMPSYLAPP